MDKIDTLSPPLRKSLPINRDPLPKCSRKRVNGFTLVELVVTLGILVAIVTATLVNLRSTNMKAELNQAAEDVRSAIYETRSLALAPETHKTFEADGYRFLVTSPRTYEIWEILLVAGTTNHTAGVRVKTNQLPSSLMFVLPNGENSRAIDFSIPRHGMVISPNPFDEPLVRFLIERQDGASTAGTLELYISTITGQVDIRSTSS